MLFSAKPILFFVLFACCVYVAVAQPNSGSLPSLFSSKSTDTKSDSDTDIEQTLKQKMFVKVFTNKNKVFVGEPVMATYKFYVASNINDRPTVTKQPEFSGCSVKELDFEQGPQFERINNESYSVYTIRKVQLTPLQEGGLSLGKAYVNNAVELYNPDDPFVTKKFNITVGNADAAIEVSNLPQKNKPEDFYGITGTFSIVAAAADSKIPVGENGHLIVTIKGAGNLDAINEPEITWPRHTEHFEGKDSQHVNENNFPVSGDRVFDIPFIGKKEGIFKIAPIQFSFFNTASKNYQTITTDSIAITFTKPPLQKYEFTNVVNYDITNRKYLWIVPAIAATVALVGFISYRRNKMHALKTAPATSVTAAPVFAQPQPVFNVKYRTDFSRHLNELESITDNKQFYTKAKDLLTKAVAERLDSAQYSEQVLITELKQRTYNAPVCNKVAALYEAFNLNIYAPFETEADLAFYFGELKNVVETLQEES